MLSTDSAMNDKTVNYSHHYPFYRSTLHLGKPVAARIIAYIATTLRFRSINRVIQERTTIRPNPKIKPISSIISPRYLIHLKFRDFIRFLWPQHNVTCSVITKYMRSTVNCRVCHDRKTIQQDFMFLNIWACSSIKKCFL